MHSCMHSCFICIYFCHENASEDAFEYVMTLNHFLRLLKDFLQNIHPQSLRDTRCLGLRAFPNKNNRLSLFFYTCGDMDFKWARHAWSTELVKTTLTYYAIEMLYGLNVNVNMRIFPALLTNTSKLDVPTSLFIVLADQYTIRL